VLGTLPGLYSKAGEQGRKTKHIIIGIVSCLAMCLLLLFIQDILKNVSIPTDNILVWLFAGVLMAMGAIVPGLSPSNFILYMGIYTDMMKGIRAMSPTVLLPILIGAAACVLLLSKAFDKLFEKAYAGMYHFILGIIIASSIMIVPYNGKVLENGEVWQYDLKYLFICIATCLAGITLGYVMSLLEKKYKE
jgi:putative membrane protein